MPPRPGQAGCPRFALQQCLNSQRFSTSSKVHAQIPPESPKYIYVPRSVQPQAVHRPWVKGVLPIPRQIFSRNPDAPDKTTTSYLASVTPEPIEDRSTRVKDPRIAERISWKARQAASRRQNLRESLIELRHRKQQTDARISARSARKQALNKTLREAPEREDERLTGPTVLQSDRPTKYHVLPDPDREARLASKRDNVARMEAMKVEERRYMLHTLYMNAGDFITTGEQLDKAVDNAFDDLDQFNNAEKRGLNIWNLGYPETVQELLGRNSRGRAVNASMGSKQLAEQRMKKIAEELTGGKMPEQSAS